MQLGASVKASYGVVKAYDGDHQKRKLEAAQAKPQAAKRARADENAHEKTSALIEELLERETRALGATQPPADCAQAGAPTDFSGLFQALEAGGAAALPSQRAARTFEDLAGQRVAGRQVLGDLLPTTDWLPPALPAVGSNAADLAAAAVAAGDRQLPPAAAPPLDWSLKTTVRFTSPTPFAIAEEAALLPGAAVVAAQRAFVSCDAGTHSLSMQQRYLAALHSWQYPQDPWRAPCAGAAKLRAPPPEMLQRRADWQAAFCSLYDALRSGCCDAFYYLSPEGTKKPCAVLFGAAGVGGRRRIHALHTRSSAGLRALLSGGLGLGFAAPLLPADADRRLELDQSAVPLDGSQSLLVFEGAVRVHGLFDFLLNESFRSHGDECDVPSLLAPVQFAHASMHALQPKVLGKSEARGTGGVARAQHRLELRGAALPPWVLDRLAAVLAITQDCNFSMACDTNPLTLALNWFPSGSMAEAAAEEGGSRRGSRRQPLGGACALVQAEAEEQPVSEYQARMRGCWDADEAARWRAAVPGLSCNVVRELRCEAGAFVAKLSAKSAERVVL